MSEARTISYQPTDGLSYDPSDPVYWDDDALFAEVERVFEVCHGCRMCFKYCDTFPTLFEWIDNKYDGDVTKITRDESYEALDTCFQCKLCEVQCPYTPRDGHEFQLDFPKLVHRAMAIRTKKDGLKKRDKILGNPDKAARMARASFGIANKMNKVALHRWFMEKLLGIHRKKLLPDFARKTFSKWARTTARMRERPDAEAVLFPTCYVENNEPHIGRDTVEVFEKNQVDLACVEGLGCCGMPSWEKGDLETVRQRARRNLDVLMPFVLNGAKIVVLNPTCSMMMRREYPELLEGADRERASKLAGAIQDSGEFLWSIRDEERFNTEFQSSPGATVAYHAPCHLRAQAIGFRGRDLLRKIPGVRPKMTMECCGHDGTYAMTVEGFEPSQRVGKKAFDGMQGAQAQVWATECPLAALQFQQHAGRKPMHPMSVLARAYRQDGFDTPVASPPTEEESTS